MRRNTAITSPLCLSEITERYKAAFRGVQDMRPRVLHRADAHFRGGRDQGAAGPELFNTTQHE